MPVFVIKKPKIFVKKMDLPPVVEQRAEGMVAAAREKPKKEWGVTPPAPSYSKHVAGSSTEQIRQSNPSQPSLTLREGGLSRFWHFLIPPLRVRGGKEGLLSLRSRRFWFGLAASLVVIVGIVFFLNRKSAAAAWWNENWLYRKRVDLTSISSNQTDFQVSITLDTRSNNASGLIYQGKLLSDCADIRVTDINGKLLPHWIETGTNQCDSQTTAIWTKVPSVVTTGTAIYVYYGNSQVVNIASGTSVFQFFDDFSGSSIDTGNWTVTGSVTAGSGLASISTGAKIRSNLSYGYSIMDYRMQTAAGDGTNKLAAAGYRDVTDTNNAILYTNSATTTNVYSSSKAASSATTSAALTVTDRTAMQNYRINRYSASGTLFYQNGSQISNPTTNVPTGSLELEFSNTLTFTTTLDWVFVHKTVSTMPTVTLSGTEEQSTGPAAYWKFDEGSGQKVYDSVTAKDSADYGTGADGNCSVPSGTVNVTAASSNTCVSRAKADAVNFSSTVLTSVGATYVTVSTNNPDTLGLAVGDEILVINLQGTSSNYSTVGQYETRRIASFSGANNVNINVTVPFANAYDGTTQQIMVQRVPNYGTVTVSGGATLTVDAFNGTKNGVLFFRATGTVTASGTIDMNAKGYTATYPVVMGVPGGSAGGGSGSSTFPGGGGGGGGQGGSYGAVGSMPAKGGGGGGGGAYAQMNNTSTGAIGGSGDGVVGGNSSTTGSAGANSGGGGGSGAVTLTGGAGGTSSCLQMPCTAPPNAGNGGAISTSGNGNGGYYADIGTPGPAGVGSDNFKNVSTYGSSDLQKLYLGSNGATGGTGANGNGLASPGTGGAGGGGGTGGGILTIFAPIVTTSGAIRSNGGNGSNGTAGTAGAGSTWLIGAGGGGGGSGGGGAGGSVLIKTGLATLGSSLVTASGGTAGTGAAGGAGGHGDDGCGTGTAGPAGAANGGGGGGGYAAGNGGCNGWGGGGGGGGATGGAGSVGRVTVYSSGVPSGAASPAASTYLMGNNGYLGGSDTSLPVDPTWAAEDMCVSGKCLKFDGSTQYASVPSTAAINLTGDATWEGWFKFITVTGITQYLIQKDNSNGYSMFLNSSGQLSLYIHPTSINGNTVLSASQWYHLAVVKSGTTVTFYVNGKADGTGTVPSSIPTNSLSLGLGVKMASMTGYFGGFMDEVKIYNYGRTAIQVKQDFNAHGGNADDGTGVSIGSNAQNSMALSNGLVGYWKMDESSGNANDSSGNGNTLTSVNTPAFSSGKFSNAGSFTAASSQYMYQSQSLTLQPDAASGLDTYLYGVVAPGSNQGTAINIEVGRGATTSLFRTLIKFDVSSIPSNATISSSTLTLYNEGGGGTTENIGVYRGLTQWWEGSQNVAPPGAADGSTWNYRNNNTGNYVQWGSNTAGGLSGTDFAVSPTSSTSATYVTGFLNWDVKADVAAWVAGSATNYGLWLIGNEGSTSTYKNFTSSDGATSGNRPQLVVNYPSTVSLSSNLTVSAWIKPSSVTAATQFDIAGKWDGANTDYQLAQYATDIRFYVGSSSNYVTTSSAGLVTGNWYHVVGTYNATAQTVTIFINGVLQATTTTGTIPSSISATLGRFQVGAQDSTTTPTNFYNGLIDEVRLYNRALSVSEVSQLYNWAPGPVGYWKFDDHTGVTANDSSGNGFSGTLNGTLGSQWKPGKFGTSLNFNGSDNFLSVSNSATLMPPNDLSISIWVKLSQLSSAKGEDQIIYVQRNVASPYASFDLTSLAADDKLYFHWWNTSNTKYEADGPTISINAWHHVEVVRSGTQFKMYVDGVDSTTWTDTTTGTMKQSDSTLNIGANSGVNYRTNGQIDEVKIYNYARTGKQVVEDMNGGHPAGGSPVGSTIGWWKFDEGYGTTAHDASPSNVSGTLGSSVTWSTAGKYNKALSFPANANGYVDATNSIYKFNSTNDFTISTWVNVSSVSLSSPMIVSQYSTANKFGYGLGIDQAQNKFYFSICKTNVACNSPYATATLTTGTWYQLVGVYQNQVATLYLNGVSQGSATWSQGAVSAADDKLYFGNDNSGLASRYLNGLLDEIKIYNYALSPDEVLLDYNHGSALTLGTTGTTAAGVPDNSAAREYCVPGDSTSCSAPVAYWNLNEGTGSTANDISGNGIIGTWTGSDSHWQSGKIGKAGSFTGSNGSASGDYITANDNSPSSALNFTSSDFTLEAWINPTALPAATRIMARGTYNTDGYNFSLLGDELNVTTNQAGALQNSFSASGSVVTNVWQHVVAVRSGTTVKFYKNGVLLGYASQGTHSNPTTSSGAFEIGREGATVWPFNGAIDDVKVYNYARSAAQVAWDYNRGKPISYYNLDECQGTTIHDVSSNQFNGTWMGVTAAGTCSTAGTAWGNGAAGKWNASLAFNPAVNDYVDLGTASQFNFGTGDYSIAYWVKYAGLADYYPPVSNSVYSGTWDGTHFENDTGGSICGVANRMDFSVTSSTICSTTVIATGTWYHIVGVRSAGVGYIYVNGKLEGSGAAAGNVSVARNFMIGRNPDAVFWRVIDGQIDDVRFYNYGLTAAQVQMLYNNGSAVNFN